MIGFGIKSPKNKKYANVSVGSRVILMVSGGCLLVRGFNSIEIC